MVKPSDIGSIYVHGSQGMIADVFSKAESRSPVILCFDEFDAMVPARSMTENSPNQANEVNEFLVQLNNCAERGIYVLAMTNRPDMIDRAVLRKGRIDELIYVPLPDREARKGVFSIGLDGRICSGDIDCDRLKYSRPYLAEDLKELGFEPQKYDDLGYVFDMEGIHILYIGDEDTPSFIRFAVPSIFDITDENRAEITGIMYELTKELKYVKAFDINDSVWISYEHCLVSPEELETGWLVTDETSVVTEEATYAPCFLLFHDMSIIAHAVKYIHHHTGSPLSHTGFPYPPRARKAGKQRCDIKTVLASAPGCWRAGKHGFGV